MTLDFKYDRSEKIGDYIYFYKGDEIIAVYNPFVGFCRNGVNLKHTTNEGKIYDC